MNKTKYLQTDSRWGGLVYPRPPYYLRNCGCGEVAICNCIIEMDRYKSYTPATIQPYCKQYADPNGNGTYWSGIPAMMKYYGMTEVQEHANMTSLWKELENGNRVVVYLMGAKAGGSKGVHWTSGGHYVCSVAYKYENGKHWVYVKDSYSNSSLRNGWISYEDNMRGDVVKVWSGKIPAKKKAYVPKTAYKGKLPTKTLKHGDRGTQVERLKDFLKWRFNYKFSNDVFGAGTEKAVRNFQRKYAKQYGLAVDGIFGPACLKVAKKIVDKYEKKYGETRQDKMCNWAKKIADETKYHYVRWIEGVAKTHTCPICEGRKYDDYYGWNCIGFAWASWHHGAGLPSKCNDFVFTDYHYNQLLKLSYDDAVELAKQRIGLDDIYFQRNSAGLSMSQLKPGDVIAYFDGSGYVHTALYIGDGKIADCTSGRSDGIKYGVPSYTCWKIKLAFRYTGK